MLARLLLSLAAFAALTAFAAADEGAYPVLLSMGRAAATDRGPQVGELPAARSGARRSGSGAAMRQGGFAPLTPADASNELSAVESPVEALADAAASAPATVSASSFLPSSALEAPALNSEAARMKRWAMRFLRLAPSPRRVRAGRKALAPRDGLRPVRAAVARDQDGNASRDGARRGFSELLAVASCDLP